MLFSPFGPVMIRAVPDEPSTVPTYSVSTPASVRPLRSCVPKASWPTFPIIETGYPSRATATAWFAPLPPKNVVNVRPVAVSPTCGMRSVLATRSRLILPTTTMGFCMNFDPNYQATMGAIAIDISPTKKKMNIAGINFRDSGGALANSFQMNTPQTAETIVAPCPIAYDTAGPTICAWDATKLKTIPVHQISPPTTPQKCHTDRALKYCDMFTGAAPVSGFFINK